MDIAAGISVALSNALRVEEIHNEHIQELRRLMALAIPASACPNSVHAADLQLRSENKSLHGRVAAQEFSIAKLHHQARALTKCASRALELLIRSRGSSAAGDPEILQLRKCLRKSGVLESADGNHGEGSRVACVESGSKEVQVTAETRTNSHHSDVAKLPLSQVPAHHAKRQRGDKSHQLPEAWCSVGAAAYNSASEVPKAPRELCNINSYSAVNEDDPVVTSLPIPIDCSDADPNVDELFDDPTSVKYVHLHAAEKEMPSEPLTSAPLIRPPATAQFLTEAAPVAASHWTSAQPGSHRMKFAAPVAATAAPSGGTRIAWDAPHAPDDFAIKTRSGNEAADLMKFAPVSHRQSTEFQVELLPPTIEKPQNFIQVVRGGARDKLPGHGCKQCDDFYAALESALPQGHMPTNACGGHHAVDARAAVASIRDNASRHRAAYRKQDSPEDYWTTKFKE